MRPILASELDDIFDDEDIIELENDINNKEQITEFVYGKFHYIRGQGMCIELNNNELENRRYIEVVFNEYKDLEILLTSRFKDSDFNYIRIIDETGIVIFEDDLNNYVSSYDCDLNWFVSKRAMFFYRKSNIEEINKLKDIFLFYNNSDVIIQLLTKY